MEQLTENLGAAELHLDPADIAALDKVSLPQPNTYPYGEFGQAQRDRGLQGGDPLSKIVSEGSQTPWADRARAHH